jgi:hypothetical protein
MLRKSTSKKWRHDDEHKDEKQSLKLYLAEYEPKVKEARERLNQLEARFTLKRKKSSALISAS